MEGEKTILVAVSKTVDDVTYQFECDGTPCTNRTIIVSHLTFDAHIEFTDATVVAYSGTVSIAGTSESNGQSKVPCPVADASVCAINHFGSNEQLACRLTNSQGKRA